MHNLELSVDGAFTLRTNMDLAPGCVPCLELLPLLFAQALYYQLSRIDSELSPSTSTVQILPSAPGRNRPSKGRNMGGGDGVRWKVGMFGEALSVGRISRKQIFNEQCEKALFKVFLFAGVRCEVDNSHPGAGQASP